MTFKASSIALASGLLLAAAQAGAVTITFETLAVGTILDNQFIAQGATFTANAFSGANSNSTAQGWATNTDMTIVASSGADVGGLGTPSLVSGNILRSFNGWLGENGDPSFLITFGFNGANAVSIDFAGVSTPSDTTLLAYNGATLLGTVTSTVTTGQFTLSFAAAKITRVAIAPGSYGDWVGVDNVTYTLAPVPEASTYAMMAVGLALLTLRRRRG